MPDLRADQAFLRDMQYRSDANLAARQSIYAYQHPRIDLAARVLDLADPLPSGVVADIGCGNGRYLAELARRGLRGHLIGADLSFGMLAAARTQAPAASLIAADASGLPLRDGIAALTLAMHMLYHVPDPVAAAREMRSSACRTRSQSRTTSAPCPRPGTALPPRQWSRRSLPTCSRTAGAAPSRSPLTRAAWSAGSTAVMDYAATVLSQ